LPRPPLVAVVLVSLVLVAPSAAHVGATPPFLAAGSSDTIHLDVPNELDEPMTGFSVTVPDGFEIVHAHPSEGWDTTFDSSTATWTGGVLATGASATFGVELQTPSAPTVVDLGVVLRYGSSGVVRWPVAFTVTPADESPSQNVTLVGVVALVGLLVLAAIVALAWRRRSGSLQER
jgi:MYXO-CTERM domain-containing protein